MKHTFWHVDTHKSRTHRYIDRWPHEQTQAVEHSHASSFSRPAREWMWFCRYRKMVLVAYCLVYSKNLLQTPNAGMIGTLMWLPLLSIQLKSTLYKIKIYIEAKCITYPCLASSSSSPPAQLCASIKIELHTQRLCAQITACKKNKAAAFGGKGL